MENTNKIKTIDLLEEIINFEGRVSSIVNFARQNALKRNQFESEQYCVNLGKLLKEHQNNILKFTGIPDRV